MFRSVRGLAALALALAAGAGAQVPLRPDTAAEATQALAEARALGAEARTRAEALERDASSAGQAADRTARDAAAAAARIQEAQAQIGARQAGIALIDAQREELRARLAARQLPVVRLTAALQRLTRRPLLVTLLRPGSVADTMHTRALLATMLPQVQARTAALRSEIDRAKVLRAQAEGAVKALKTEQGQLVQRRTQLAALETRQRLALRATSGSADREAERALALAEQARDLDGLAVDLARAGALREELAALPGPLPRPGAGEALAPDLAAASPTESAAPQLVLPVQGRLVAGFGTRAAGGALSKGIALAAAPGAQAVAPAAGRVAFAGLYRGYGAIVIVDHGGGWTSLVTGLARADVRVGDSLLAGSPLGVAGQGRPVVSYEVRKGGVAVNPLDLVGRG